MAVFTAIASAVAAGLTAIAGAAGFTLATAALATAITVTSYAITSAIFIFGGIALSRSASSKSNGLASSPTYASPIIQTQTNNALPVAMIYGENKLAGNSLKRDGDTTITRIIAFGEGEIEGFSDIRLNNIAIGNLNGCSYTAYTGTSEQEVDSRVSGSTHAIRAEIIGCLKNIAYLAITATKSTNVDKNYNLTTIVKGRKVKIYTDEDNYTIEYSNNPAWCLFDVMTSYNGLGLGLNDYGTFDNDTAKQILDIQSFIDAADYCNEDISYYSFTTELSTANSNLYWKGRTANDNSYTIEYLLGENESISVDGKDISVTITAETTANTIISLVNNNSDILDIVNVFKAEDEDGTGIVEELAKTSFIAGDSTKRFTFNMIFDSQFTVRDAIEEIKKNCRGALVTKGSQIQFKIDMPESVAKIFTADDIFTKSETFQTISQEEQYDRLNLTFISPDNDWAKVEAHAELEDFNDIPVEHSIDIYSVTNFEQASRLAWYYVNSKKLCPYLGSFQTGFKAYDLEIGDVIQINSPLMGFSDYKVKVTRIQDDNSGVYTIYWRNYDERLYNDELGSQEITALSTSLDDYYSYPNDVTNFNVVQNQKLLEFSWSTIDDVTATYEIRQGETWDSSDVVAKGLTSNKFTSTDIKKGTLNYWIKAFNGYNTSENATLDIISVQYIPEMNVVVENKILENTTGATLTDCYIYKNRLKLDPNETWSDLSPEKWLDEGLRVYADNNNYWSMSVDTSGIYESQIFDIGSNLTSIISSNKDFYSWDENATCEVEWSYSEDGINYSDWTILTTGSYTFRYYKIRVTINSPNNMQCMLSDLIITIDVPDREENYTNREIITADDGITIVFKNDTESKILEDFVIDEPQILATSKSISSYPVVTNSTEENCTVKLYDNAGSLTTGFVNIRARGY